MKLTTEISVKLNPTEDKGKCQVVTVLTQHRTTGEVERIRIRSSPIDPDMAIIDACEQVLGVVKSKGTALVIRPTDKVPTYRVIGAWLVD